MTDLGMLKALNQIKDKLASSTATSFRRMKEDMEGGSIVALSKKQREWVERVYRENDLHKQEGKALPPPPGGKVKIVSTTVPSKYPWERTDDKPLKPPGKI